MARKWGQGVVDERQGPVLNAVYVLTISENVLPQAPFQEPRVLGCGGLAYRSPCCISHH